jgi:hypothetical protein
MFKPKLFYAFPKKNSDFDSISAAAFCCLNNIAASYNGLSDF